MSSQVVDGFAFKKKRKRRQGGGAKDAVGEAGSSSSSSSLSSTSSAATASNKMMKPASGVAKKVVYDPERDAAAFWRCFENVIATETQKIIGTCGGDTALADQIMQASSDFDKRMRARCDAEWESAAPKMKQNPKNAVNMLQKNRLEKRIAAFKEELAGWKRAEEAAAKAADGGASSSSSSSSSSSAAAAGGADDENAMPPEQLLTAEEQGFLEGRVEAAALRSKVAGTVNKAAMQTDRLHKMVRDSKKLEAECAKSQHQLTGALHERAFDGLPQVRNPKAIIKSILSFPGGAAAAVEGETPGAAAVDRA